MSSEDRKAERLSVSLDYESAKLIDELEKKLDTSRSEVIRESLKCLDTVWDQGEIQLSTVKTYLEYLQGKEHLVLDISLLNAMLLEIGEGSEDFWKEVREIGKEHWKERENRGFEKVEDVLKYFEKTNIFSLYRFSKNSFILKPSVRESEKWQKEFFKGFFEASPYEAEITTSRGKIRIKILSSSQE
ncbi:hypothetical protein AKJ37_04625 [candidate division MSBL1 archaeon SCGC-AAA259I09]|uniref:Ribbon-helix-helix protein CopG domain-containing protein n=3 Tax=candidate division MSBL1 TaxID=215777 RepID=A0A133UR07_9EURY|nr:hypothetical protein AKJ36_01495 [candidate division MSBL1 archaeon SCGC-AAA259I07]KXA96692.1 hypothetical protein AKJ37_04625 [candidate division MSBL1 archaeon SCGC-AAA259I09]